MQGFRVLVTGGYGFFGSRLVERLSHQPGLHVLVSGRSLASAQALVHRLQPGSASQLEAVALDAMGSSFGAALAAASPDIVIHTCGPFQGQDHRVASACIANGVHYIDIADGREFVSGITALDADAKAAGVLATSGASSVPALSSAVVDRLASGLARLDHIDIGISPGNRSERGLATVRAGLGYCGKPLPDSGGRPGIGWSGSYRHRYDAPVGSRLLSPCDVPDLVLLPARYASRPSVRFGAGLELEFLHRGMNAMALLARAGLVRDWSVHAPILKRIADWFRGWGSDAGAMHVQVQGRDAAGRTVEKSWQLLATHGDGPFVPTLAAAALVRKCAEGDALPRGAMPCLGLLALDDFAREAQGLNITTRTIE